MAGKFTRTSNLKIEMPNLIASTVKDLLNNPYYLFNNASASNCTYYNLNTTLTTLDEAVRNNYGEISPESPLRYNKIKDFQLYGINKIEPNLDVSDYGLEGSDVTGDAIVLPGTIIPYPDDFFCLDQIKDGKQYLFKVTSVQPNTLDTGAVMYRINYILYTTDGVNKIDMLVAKIFKYSIANYGSNFGCIIEELLFDQLADLEKYCITLKDYFIQLYYDTKIQSFSYIRNNCIKVYDPYLIEFIIRNNVLKGSTEYIHVSQQISLPITFGVSYDKTFFSCLEEKDYNKHYFKCAGNLEICTQKLSLLYAYPEDYYCMEYDRLNTAFHVIDIFNDPEFMEKIRTLRYTNNVLKNIIIRYFNEINIDREIMDQLKHVDYIDNEELYYLIPFTIFCIEKMIDNMIVTKEEYK